MKLKEIVGYWAKYSIEYIKKHLFYAITIIFLAVLIWFKFQYKWKIFGLFCIIMGIATTVSAYKRKSFVTDDWRYQIAKAHGKEEYSRKFFIAGGIIAALGGVLFLIFGD